MPVSASLAIALAVLPKWRWLSRWPTAAVAVAAAVLARVAAMTGEQLMTSRQLGELVRQHEQRGDLLALVMMPFAALLVLAAWALGGPTALASGRGARESRVPVLEKVLPPVLVLASVAIVVLTVLVGHSGAKAVWGPFPG